MIAPLRHLTLILLIAVCPAHFACSSADEGARLRVSPASIDFGAVALGEALTTDVLVENIGGSEVTLRLEANPPLPGTLRFASESASIPAGESAAVSLTFTPERVGPISTQLTISHDRAGLDSVTVFVVGEGAERRVQVDPANLDFSNVVVGTTKTLSLTVTNTSPLDGVLDFLGGTNARLCTENSPSQFCLRAGNRSFDGDGRIPLAAGEVVSLEVQYEPLVAGTRSDGTLRFSICDAPVCEFRVQLSGFGVEAGLRCRPPILDFGQVNPGSSETLTVTCENIANERVTIVTWMTTADSDPAFEAQAPMPKVLNQGDTATIEVSYAPPGLSDAAGTLRMETDSPNPALRSVDVDLLGTGGGPDIEVAPVPLDFGRVSVLAPARRNLVITNTGFSQLILAEIQVDTDGTGAFALLVGGPLVLPPGESATIVIEFQPRVAGPIVSRLRILSNDGDESTVDVELRGEGVSLPPCNFSFGPSRLDFGPVSPGRSLRRSVEVRNRGTEECLLTGTRLKANTHTAFSLPEGSIASRTIPAGSSLTIPVAFSPRTSADVSGQLEFSISNPTEPFSTIDLAGRGDESALLIVPNEVDFGTVSRDCAPAVQTVTFTNPGSMPIEISAVDLAADSNSTFTLLSLPSSLPSQPLSLSPGASTTIQVGMQATAGAGAYAGAVSISGSMSGAPVTYYVPLEARSTQDGVQVDDYVQAGNPKVDVLMVLDKSGCTGDERDALADNVSALVQFAAARGLDYHVGVTTADTDDEAGRLTSAMAGTTQASSVDGPVQNRIVTSQTLPSPAAVLASNVSHQEVGGSAADESGLEAAYQALSAQRINGHNDGFLRSDAALSILFMSDEADQSPRNVDFYLDFFRVVKGYRNPELFSAYAISAPFPPGRCTGPSGASRSSAGRYIELAERSGGAFESICTSDWRASIESLAQPIFGLRSRFFLRHVPLISTLKVVVDGSELPQQAADGSVNWTYDVRTNSVRFPPFSIPEPESEVRLSYAQVCQ